MSLKENITQEAGPHFFTHIYLEIEILILKYSDLLHELLLWVNLCDTVRIVSAEDSMDFAHGIIDA